MPRDECFAPVKNAPGSGKADSPDTARAMISHLNRRRLEAAGAKLPPAVAGELIEVSPLVSYQGEGLEAAVSGVKALVPPVDLREGTPWQQR